MLIDTHCHIHSKEHYPDPDQVVEEALEAGVEVVILVGTDASDGRVAAELAERHEGVFFISGIHPNYSAGYQSSDLKELEAVLAHPKCLAMGEIGLDFHWDYSPREVQERCLKDQLDLAGQLELPVVFHCRDANAQLLDLLETRPTQPYLIHCFSGNEGDAQRALKLGALLGVDGPVTYKKNGEYRDLLSKVGLQNLVLETDSPYLSPEPHRGKANAPKYLPLIGSALASALGLSLDDVARGTSDNAARFFGLNLDTKKRVDFSLA